MRLRDAAVGIAIGEAANDARELGGNNRGKFVRKYLASSGFGEGAPWCAAFVYWCILEAAEFLGTVNPLLNLERKALVAAYIDFARDHNWIVEPAQARAGDLVTFRWSSGNHIGFLLEKPPVLAGRADVVGSFWTVEGNTSPGVGLRVEEREREGDGVYRKRRHYLSTEVFFLRWDEGRSGPRAAVA